MPSETVKVMVRCRPMNKLEIGKNCQSCVSVDTSKNQIILTNGKDAEATKVFTYDYQTVYENSAFPLIESVVEGYNGTMFAYGQTGCGKTHSMLGKPNDEVEKGIIPRAFSHIINIVESANDKNFLIHCSYMEIYNEEIHDLLGNDVKARMDLKESPDKGIFVKDLTKNVVKSVVEMEKWMNIGNENRSVGATAMNKDSSRSHSIFTLYIECSYKNEGDPEEHITAGKLNLVDLAGSERYFQNANIEQSKTHATGDRLKEATKINLSLSALGNVISALVDGKSSHIPYRDSKLTRLLQDSLGGNTKTIMIAAISPADYNYEETLSTLRYASRAKNIKNQPIVNQDPKDALLKEYADEIKKLKELLLRQQAGEQISIDGFAKQSLTNIPSSTQIPPQRSSSQILSSTEVKKLKEKNDALNAERQQMEDELKKKEQLFQQQIEEKAKIEQMLQEVEQKFMIGGTADQEKKKKISQMRNKLKKQMQEHEKMQDEISKKEEEFLFLENKYSSLQEELDATKKIARKLRSKFKQAQNDINDIEKENEIAKEDLLDTIRFQQREIKIYQSICQMLLSNDEIDIIKSQGEWQDDYQVFRLPPFFFKQKRLNFPKLPVAQALDMVEKEKKIREIEFSKVNNLDYSRNNQQSFNGYQNNNSYQRVPSRDGTNTYEEMNKFQFGNGYGNKQNNSNRYMNGYSNDYDDYDTSRNDGGNSLTSIQESNKEKNNSPHLRIKKNNVKTKSQSEKPKVPNVSLDPLDSQRYNNQQKLFNLQEAIYKENNQHSEQRKLSQKNIQLEPLQGVKQLGNSQSIMNIGVLNNKNINNENIIDFDQYVHKMPNKVKLDKIYIPR